MTRKNGTLSVKLGQCASKPASLHCPLIGSAARSLANTQHPVCGSLTGPSAVVPDEVIRCLSLMLLRASWWPCIHLHPSSQCQHSQFPALCRVALVARVTNPVSFMMHRKVVPSFSRCFPSQHLTPWNMLWMLVIIVLLVCEPR